MKLSSFVIGSVSLVYSVFTAVAVASAAPPSSAGVPSHPDDSDFEIPVLAQPRNGFGEALEKACDSLSKLVIQNSAGRVIAPGAPVSADIKNALGHPPDPNSPADTDALADVVSQLKQICQRIDRSQLSDSDVNALLAFEGTGTFPTLVAALQASAMAEIEKAKPASGTAQAKAAAADAAADEVHAASGRDIAKNMLARENVGAGPDSAPTMAGFEGNLLNGLADFLVTRSKEEAILYLQSELSNQLCKGAGAALLANTCSTVKGLDEKLSVAAIGTVLNAAAKRDLVRLPNGILRLAARNDPEHYYAFELGRLLYAIALAADSGRLPQDAARSLYALPLRACESASDSQLSAADKHCRASFMAVRFASALLYSVESNGITQIYDKLGTHRGRTVGTVVEAAFRYNQQFSTGLTLPLTAKLLNTVDAWLAVVGEAEKQWSQRQVALTTTGNNVNATDRKRLLGTSLFDTIARVSQLVDKLAPEMIGDEQAQKFIEYTKIMRDAAAVGRDFVTEDYGSIPPDAQVLVADLDVIEHGQSLAIAFAEVSKYMAVIVEVSAAKSSADVASAFNAAAAPADSYRAKYQRSLASVNALVGGIIGKEQLNDPNNPTLGRAKPSAMVAGFAPVGFEVTTPFSSSFYGGLMLSVIDVGALTTARFKQEASTQPNVSTTSDVTLAQVFSPGVFGMIGLFHSPLVLGGGASFAPSLRTLQTTEAATGATTKETVSGLRFGGFLAMDVPILSL